MVRVWHKFSIQFEWVESKYLKICWVLSDFNEIQFMSFYLRGISESIVFFFRISLNYKTFQTMCIWKGFYEKKKKKKFPLNQWTKDYSLPHCILYAYWEIWLALLFRHNNLFINDKRVLPILSLFFIYS
jgi:hypothetical protein